jgi:phage terminase Nu1 subunit (DNA packaging protein)
MQTKNLTVKQLSAMIGLSRQQIHTYTKRGLPVNTYGPKGHIRLYDLAKVQKWLDRNRKPIGRPRGSKKDAK